LEIVILFISKHHTVTKEITKKGRMYKNGYD